MVNWSESTYVDIIHYIQCRNPGMRCKLVYFSTSDTGINMTAKIVRKGLPEENLLEELSEKIKVKLYTLLNRKGTQKKIFQKSVFKKESFLTRKINM